MWLERGADYISIPGLLVVPNADWTCLTVGAWSWLFKEKTDPHKTLVAWIHKDRFTASCLVVGPGFVSFNLADCFPALYFAGHTSGREYDKCTILGSCLAVDRETGAAYFPKSDYAAIGQVADLHPLADHLIVSIDVCKTIIREKERPRWQHI